MKSRQYDRWLRAACVVALLALGLIVWSLVDSRAIAVVLAMSIGQALGTLSLALYLLVVVADLRRHRIEEPLAPSEPPSAPPTGPEQRAASRS
jgi:energy-converting hydrogenase Eha subunit C